MKLVLQIELNDWKNRPYEKVLLSLAKSLSKDISVADIDQDSEPGTAASIVKLIDQATQVFVIVNAQPESKLGSCSEVFYQLIKNQVKVKQVLYHGNNLFAEKLLKVFDEQMNHNPTEEIAKQLIAIFCEKPQAS
jgi:hypothetical protein